MRRKGRRRAGRDRNRVEQVPWRVPRNPHAPFTVLSDDQVEAIHEASLTLLETLGMDFLDAGARVVMDRGLVLDAVAKAPAFGTPEYARAVLAGGQLARRYGLPYRSSNVNAAPSLGMQAAYESMMSLWSAVMAGADMIMHGAGWMEGGLVTSYEKAVIDAELLQMMATFLAPIEVNDDTLALDAIREAGPGGHFFGTAHTQARYETAFYQPMVSDWRGFDVWRETGEETAAQRAHGIWKRLLADYQEPYLDPAAAEELGEFVERRQGEIVRAA